MKTKVLVFLLVLVANISFAVSPNDRDTGRSLTCPVVETTELMGRPGAVLEKENGQMYTECSYFVKSGENSWESVLIVTAYWVENEGAEQFDCKWEGKENPFRYLVSMKKQAYVDVFSYRPDFYMHTFTVQKDLFDQIQKLAMPCPKE